jgi:hypothetical protein
MSNVANLVKIVKYCEKAKCMQRSQMLLASEILAKGRMQSKKSYAAKLKCYQN